MRYVLAVVVALGCASLASAQYPGASSDSVLRYVPPARGFDSYYSQYSAWGAASDLAAIRAQMQMNANRLGAGAYNYYSNYPNVPRGYYYRPQYPVYNYAPSYNYNPGNAYFIPQVRW